MVIRMSVPSGHSLLTALMAQPVSNGVTQSGQAIIPALRVRLPALRTRRAFLWSRSSPLGWNTSGPRGEIECFHTRTARRSSERSVIAFPSADAIRSS